MNIETKSTPTPAAMKAAKALAMDSAHIPSIAAIIDREAGLPELIEALRRLDSACACEPGVTSNIDEQLKIVRNKIEALNHARKVLAKHQGKETA